MTSGNSKKPPGRRGRPPESRNKQSLFELQHGMDILREVAHCPENKNLSPHQVTDEAARVLYGQLFEGVQHGPEHLKFYLDRFRKRLEREQTRLDSARLAGEISLHECCSEEWARYLARDPDDAGCGPLPLDWEESREDHLQRLDEEFPTLPQGFRPKSLEENFAKQIGKRPPTKNRKLKGR